MTKEEKTNRMLNALTGLKMRYPNGADRKTIINELKLLKVTLNNMLFTECVKANVLKKFGNAQHIYYVLNPTFEGLSTAYASARDYYKRLIKHSQNKAVVEQSKPTSLKSYKKLDIDFCIKYLKQHGYIVIKPISNATITITQTIVS